MTRQHVHVYLTCFEWVPRFQFAFALRPNQINTMSTVCNFTFVSGLSWLFVFVASQLCLCETERVCRQRLFLKAGQGNETISIFTFASSFSQAYADLKRMPNIKIINTGKYKASEHGFMHVRLKIENMIRRKRFC